MSIQFGCVTDQLEFTETELLASHDFAEPLIAGGVRCHGGFDDDGAYVSPRTKNRVPAIERVAGSSTASSSAPTMLDVPLETWPELFPNVAQSKYLLERGRARAD